MRETSSNDMLSRLLYEAMCGASKIAGSLCRGAMAQAWVLVSNERTGRCDDMSTKGEPWKVVSRKAEDKWLLSKFRTASMEVTMTRRGNDIANETVQDALQQQQVSVFEDVGGLPGRIYGRGGKAVEYGVRGSMLVPVFADADLATAAPVAVMELVLLESNPFSYGALLEWLHEKLPMLHLYTPRDISHWYDENGKDITPQASREARLPQEPQTEVDMQMSAQGSVQPSAQLANEAKLQAEAQPEVHSPARAQPQTVAQPDQEAPLEPAEQPAIQALPATQVRPRAAALSPAQAHLHARPQAALQEQQDVLAEPSTLAPPSPASAATAVAAPMPRGAAGPRATVPARVRRGPNPSAVPQRQVTLPAMTGSNGRLTRAQRSAAVAAQYQSSRGNPAATLPCELPEPEAPAEQQVPATIIAASTGRSVACPKWPRGGAAEAQPSGKESTGPRRSGRLLTTAACDKVEDGTGAQSRGAGKRPRVQGRNASGRSLQQLDMAEVENEAPAVEEEPLQRRGVRRSCTPLADNTADESNNTLDKVVQLSFGKVKQVFGLPLSEAAAKLGVHRAHLVRCCKENNMDGWPRLTISITDPNNALPSRLPSDVPASELGGFQPCPCAHPRNLVPKGAKK